MSVYTSDRAVLRAVIDASDRELAAIPLGKCQPVPGFTPSIAEGRPRQRDEKWEAWLTEQAHLELLKAGR